MAAETAAPAPPPCARIATAANWAEPANTISDITIASSAVNPACVATTPNEIAS